MGGNIGGEVGWEAALVSCKAELCMQSEALSIVVPAVGEARVDFAGRRPSAQAQVPPIKIGLNQVLNLIRV